MCHILSAQVKIKLSSELVTADQKIGTLGVHVSAHGVFVFH